MDEIVEEIQAFIIEKIRSLSTEDFRAVLSDLISDLEAQIIALDEDEK